jgi:alkylation response protein AidB-like acyl-CoA dehydrogenase
VRGFERLDGDEGFAEVFCEDAFVADQYVLGEVDQGWSVAMATTGSERGLTLRSPGRFTAAAGRLADLYRRVGRGSAPSVRERVVEAWMAAEAYQLFTLADVTRIVDGDAPGARSSLNKLFWSELDVQLHETALDLLGPRGELVDDSPGAIDGGAWMKGYEFALAGPIYAGTNEIQRNVVAERVLGLPRGGRR